MNPRSFALLTWVLTAVVPAGAQRRQQGETFDDGIVRVASTIAPRVEGRTVAVFEFPDLENRITNLSRLVSEQLTTELVQQTIGRARVLERRQVLQVLTELNLLRTDLTAEQVSQVGRQLGADAIVLGSATTLGARVLVNARVVAVTGGEVLAADRLSVEAPQELLALASAGIGGPSLTPAPKPQSGTQTAAPGPAAAPPAAAPAAAEIRASFRQVVVVANGCTHSGSTLRCRFQLSNSGTDDVRVTLSHWLFGNEYGPTRATDSDGNEFNVQSVRIANEEGSEVTRTLVPGVQAAVTLTFDTNGEVSDRIALLELRGHADNDSFVLRLRNIPIR